MGTISGRIIITQCSSYVLYSRKAWQALRNSSRKILSNFNLPVLECHAYHIAGNFRGIQFSRLSGKPRKLNPRNKSINAHSRYPDCPSSKISGYTVYVIEIVVYFKFGNFKKIHRIIVLTKVPTTQYILWSNIYLILVIDFFFCNLLERWRKSRLDSLRLREDHQHCQTRHSSLVH